MGDNCHYLRVGPEVPIAFVGWLCPRCSKVNAPDVKQCPCDGSPDAEEEVQGETVTTVWPGPYELGGAAIDPIGEFVAWDRASDEALANFEATLPVAKADD